jgi:hypothetical protein
MKLYDVEFPVEQKDFFDLEGEDLLGEGGALLLLCPPW